MPRSPALPAPTEAACARCVVDYLADTHWDVHQEVTLRGGGAPRADIVAQQGPRLWVIEVKTSLSLVLLEQALHWLQHAHLVSIAIPAATRDLKGRRAAEVFCRQMGIGILHVRPDQSLLSVQQHLAPALGRTRVIPYFVGRLRAALTEHTRTYAAAGNADQHYWTPFRHTSDNARRALAIHGEPMTTRELIAAIDHHYVSDCVARANLRRWLLDGKIPGIVPVGERPERWTLTPEARATTRVFPIDRED